MTKFEKLFIHLFTKGIEHYRDSSGTLKAIDDILKKDEEILYDELKEAFNQANRVRLMHQYGVPMDMGEPIENKNLPPNLYERLVKDVADIEKLKKMIKRLANDRFLA